MNVPSVEQVMPAGEPSSPSIAELLAPEKFSLSAKSHVAVSRGDRWMRRVGGPLGVIAFVLLMLAPTPFGLTHSGQAAAAVFALALVWWVTEPVPTYVTSLVLMILLVIVRASDATSVLSVFGLDVIWLNILAFVLSAMLVKTQLAKRIALALLTTVGRRAYWALGGFVMLQLLLAPLIPATAARAAITLPLMIAVASIYGSTSEHATNFGRNLFLLNLGGISILSSTVMTGSSANLMAVGFLEKLGGTRVYYSDWMLASAPVAIATMVLAWLLVPRAVFPLSKSEHRPVNAGGVTDLRSEHRAMGPVSRMEWRAIIIFAIVVALWATDRYQQRWFGVELTAPIAAMIGATLALTPRVGPLEWKDADIPWHLIIFSAGAYAGGFALEKSGAAKWAVDHLFNGFARQQLAFGWVYALVLAVMLYSHLLSTSKTVRTVIMVPAIILLARGLGWPPASLALPAAFTIDWVIGLPISGKPNVILFATNQYSTVDNLKFGLFVCTIGYVLLLLAGATWFHWLGITPAFSAHA